MNVKFNPFTNSFDMVGSSGGTSFTSDTKANILATTPTAGTYAISTDTLQLLHYDGTEWLESSPKLSATLTTPDMGYYNDNDKQGYYSDTITDKILNNIVLKDSTRTDNGGLRIDFTQTPITLQVYYDNQWNDLVPFDFEPPLTHDASNVEYEVATGNSTTLDIDGNPMFNRYSASMGAFAPRVFLDGGTF